MDDWTRVLLYGTFDGFGWSTDGDDNILLVLDNGDKVEIPSHFVKNASDFVEKNQIKLKDVIARIKQLDIGTRKVWLDEFLNELGSDYGTLKYKDGYEQGKFEASMIPYEEPQKVTIPQFVADWIEVCKEHLTSSLYLAMTPSFLKANNQGIELTIWIKKNEETFARAWLDGYEVEKEKKYRVKMKGMDKEFTMLKLDKIRVSWYLGNDTEYSYTKTTHTRKELEENDFGWVFDSPGIEIEEVEG